MSIAEEIARWSKPATTEVPIQAWISAYAPDDKLMVFAWPLPTEPDERFTLELTGSYEVHPLYVAGNAATIAAMREQAATTSAP